MASRFTLPRWQALDAIGTALPGAKLYTYASGTYTAKPTYTDPALTVAHPNPIVADAAGRFPDIFPEEGLYRLRLETAQSVLIWEADHVDGKASGLDAYLPRDGSLPMAGALLIAAGNNDGIRVAGNASTWIRQPTSQPNVWEIGTGGDVRLTLTNNGIEAHVSLTVPAATAAGHAPRWEQVEYGATGWLTLSGTAFDVTGIPDGMTSIELWLREASLSDSTSHILVQVGTGTSPITSGYTSAGNSVSNSGAWISSTSGIIFYRQSNIRFYTAQVVLQRYSPANAAWTAAFTGFAVETAPLTGAICQTGGGSYFSATHINMFRITSSTGTPTLSGSVMVRWRR